MKRALATGQERAHWAPLDGVRALAIALVLAYHLGGLGGGWLGVDVFFVLSGFLITSLLAAEIRSTGTVRLGAFWGRRARRLLPAVVVLLAALGLYAWAGGPGVVPAQLRSPALATLLYAGNWQQVTAGHSYFAAFSAPSPLQHTWSLAIEEQYYVVWPLLLGLLVVVGRRLVGRRAAIIITSLAVASALWMTVAAHLWGINRAYLGTDTRAWELLFGAVAALCWPPGAPTRHPRRWSAAGVASLAGVALVTAFAGGEPGWLWDGGLVAAGLSVCAVLVACTRAREPGTSANPAAALLSIGVLCWLGRISYSVYLWHWPVIVVLNAQTSGLRGPALLAARLAAITALSCASYYLVERPLRRLDWRAWWQRSLVPLTLASTGAILVAGTVAPLQATGAPVSLPTVEATTLTAGASQTTGPATPLGAAMPPGRSGPWRVWIMGDSVINDSSAGLTAALQSTGDAQVVVNSSFGGWGLSTDHVWPADAEQYIAQYHPQVVIASWSWDDALAAEQPAAYEARLQAALGVLLHPGDGVDLVVLLQLPQPGPSRYVSDSTAWAKEVARQDDWNQLASEAVLAFPGRAVYLQTSSVFAPNDRFMQWMKDADGTWIRARKVDGVHMCPYGAAELGALVTKDLTARLALGPMRGDWATAAWTHDPRYNDPPGACPADQPPAGYDGVAVP